MKKLTIIARIRKDLKKLAKRLAESINALAIAVAGAQATGFMAMLPAMLQLKIMAGIVLLNAVVHRIKNPHEVANAKKAAKKAAKIKE